MPVQEATGSARQSTTAPVPGAARVMAFGVGAFTHGIMQILRENGAEVSAYLTRPYGHYSPALVGNTFSEKDFPNPCSILQECQIDFIVPMSIEWGERTWRDLLLTSGIPILCPTGEGLKLERERDFARALCERVGISFPRAHIAPDLKTALKTLQLDPRPYVIKNPLCSPTSPIHTIVCETVEETRAWLERLDYGEGVFLQEYMGRAEAGHIALVSGGEIHSLITNQEYKRAFAGNMGVVAGAPLGGLAERDPGDKYGIAKSLLHPLLPWFREVDFSGPVQVTGIWRGGQWHVLEYNVRLGVTSGPIILRFLENPVEVLGDCARGRSIRPRFKPNPGFGCSITLAGYGYPYVQLNGPRVPIYTNAPFDCDVWWNEVEMVDHALFATGHRIADVVGLGASMPEAIEKAYSNIRSIKSLGSYYRTDIGQSLWPPGQV